MVTRRTLHSADRETVLDEVQRLEERSRIHLHRPHAERRLPNVLQPTLTVSLETSPVEFYRTNLEQRGFVEIDTIERVDDMRTTTPE